MSTTDEWPRLRGTVVDGDVSFDVGLVSQLTNDLWIGGVVSGAALPSGVTHVVSLHPWTSYAIPPDVQALAVRMADSRRQPFDIVDKIAEIVNIWRDQGVVLVHCEMGLNRSALVAARALMLDGWTARDAIGLIRAKRSPACLCNRHFEDHLRMFKTDQP